MKIVPERIITLLILISSGFAYAGPGGGPPNPGVPPPELPIDNGVVLLLVAALIYAFYKLYQFKSVSKSSS